MFCDLEQVQNAKESRLARQLRSDIWKPYRLNRIDLNLAFLHTVSRAYFDAGTHPDSHTASDFSAAYPLAKSFSERHEESLRRTGAVRLVCKTMGYRQLSASASSIPALLLPELSKTLRRIRSPPANSTSDFAPRRIVVRTLRNSFLMTGVAGSP